VAEIVVSGLLTPLEQNRNIEAARSMRNSGIGMAMAEVTYFVAMPFVAADDGVSPGEPVECTSATAAITRAEVLSRKEGHVGAVAFSRTGDPSAGEFSDAVLLRAFGEVPSDLSAL
jgi:hypothetical protein